MACARVFGTIAAVSLFKAALKRRFQLGKKPFGLEVVAQVKLGSRAAGQTKRDQRQQNGAHLLLLPAEDLKHAD